MYVSICYLTKWSATLLNLRAGSWLTSPTKGEQFAAALLSKRTFSQFFCCLIGVINVGDTHPCEDLDHLS